MSVKHSNGKQASSAGVQINSALMAGLGAYVMWGFFPLYFNRLEPASAVEIIAHRVIWALLFCLIVMAIRGTLAQLKPILVNRNIFWRVAAGGCLIFINWSTYVYGVQTHRTVDAALGYYIAPLFTVGLALLFLHEKVSKLQVVAICLGGVAVVVLLVGMGYLPWIAIVLMVTFGGYSMVKKKVAAQVPPIAGMAVETAILAPPMIIYYGYLVWSQQTSFHKLVAMHASSVTIFDHGLLLFGSGALTAIPLIMLARAAGGVSLATLGFIQYISPTIQLLIGVYVFHEATQPARWVGTAIVWLALLVLVLDSILSGNKKRKQSQAK